MTTKEIDTNVYDKIKQDREVIGKLYPCEFLGSLADNAQATAHEWLTENGIPQEVTDLLYNAGELYGAEHYIHSGSLTDYSASELVSIVAQTAELIAKLGGCFVGGGSRTIRRDPIKWLKDAKVALDPDPGENGASIYGGRKARQNSK